MRTGRAALPRLHHLGGLAQLVERLLCKQNVSGSIPLSSILLKKDFDNIKTCIIITTRNIKICQTKPQNNN